MKGAGPAPCTLYAVAYGAVVLHGSRLLVEDELEAILHVACDMSCSYIDAMRVMLYDARQLFVEEERENELEALFEADADNRFPSEYPTLVLRVPPHEYLECPHKYPTQGHV
jgi:hypothetical protein